MAKLLSIIVIGTFLVVYCCSTALAETCTDCEKGQKGEPGTEGQRGIAGNTGPEGPMGPPGVPGPEGRRGIAGNAGATGPMGPPGVQGPEGQPGAPGPEGQPGAPGPEGHPGSIGTPGVPGPEGNQGLAGDPGPSGSEGRPGPVGRPGPPGIPGHIGEQGRDGERGRPGISGVPGNPGPPGPSGGEKGETGQPGRDGLTGRDGRDGRDGEPGPRGLPGRNGNEGPKGDMGEGLPGPRSGGVTYIRWGQSGCPDTNGTAIVYAGRAAGSHYEQKGGTNDILCLPEDPQYLEYISGVQGFSPIHGAEYQTHNPVMGHVQDQNVPCVICHTTLRESVLVIPVRVSCPDTWTLEYSGYLMTQGASHHRSSAVCVDKDPETVSGEIDDTNGILFYNIEATCNGIDCPPYVAEKELTCAVCTK